VEPIEAMLPATIASVDLPAGLGSYHHHRPSVPPSVIHHMNLSMTPPEWVDYAEDEDIPYLQLLDDSVSWTKPLDHLRLVDFSADGRMIGIEFISASGGIDLRDAPQRERVSRLVGDSGLPMRALA
jgi:uncharacterized protein YuzE